MGIQRQNQRQEPAVRTEKSLADKLNGNRTYIYTTECKLCGHTSDFAEVATKLQALGKNVEVRQTTLWAGWAEEAEEIGLELPFIYDYDTKQSLTIEEANDTDLEKWLDGDRS